MSATGVLVFDEDRISSLSSGTPGSLVVFDPDPGAATAVLDDGTSDFIVITSGGPPGPAGAGLNILGEVATVGDLPTNPSQGDAYLVQGDLWVFGTDWVDAGPIQGPAGPTGPAGADGADGLQGPAGADGADGSSAYQVAVAGGFVGTEAEWLASLVGPQGAPGADGAPGVDGADGAQGPAGDDAYQVAVTNGFVGTEAEWLASLVGPQGPAGTDGADSTVPGPDGRSAYQVAVDNGFVGTEVEWLASLQGTDGTNGTNGADGADGIGVIPGGLSGQVLAKASGADFDMTWTDPVTGSGGVTSVNSKTGAVTLTAADVGAEPAGVAAATVATHSADTTDVHGIADTSALIVTTDPRLTDARTPTAHKTTHATGGTDALAAADIGAEPAGTAASVVATHAADTTAVHGIADTSALVLTTDPRMSDARTPLAHSHPITDVTALQAALDAKVEAHTYSVTGTVAVATGKSRIYIDAACTVVSVRASVNTAPTGGPLTVDVNKNGVTIYTTQSNRPSIAAGAFVASGGTPNVTSLAAGDYLQVDVDAVGTTVAGSDLTVTVRLRRS